MSRARRLPGIAVTVPEHGSSPGSTGRPDRPVGPRGTTGETALSGSHRVRNRLPNGSVCIDNTRRGEAPPVMSTHRTVVSLRASLRAALASSDDPDVRYHLREALQLTCGLAPLEDGEGVAAGPVEADAGAVGEPDAAGFTTPSRR